MFSLSFHQKSLLSFCFFLKITQHLISFLIFSILSFFFFSISFVSFKLSKKKYLTEIGKLEILERKSRNNKTPQKKLYIGNKGLRRGREEGGGGVCIAISVPFERKEEEKEDKEKFREKTKYTSIFLFEGGREIKNV